MVGGSASGSDSLACLPPRLPLPRPLPRPPLPWDVFTEEIGLGGESVKLFCALVMLLADWIPWQSSMWPVICLAVNFTESGWTGKWRETRIY